MDIVDFVLNMSSVILKMVDNAKANKDRLQRVAQRVKALQELVLTIKQRGSGQISFTVGNALRELSATLTCAKQVMEKYSQSKPVMNFLKSTIHEDKFYKINERLTDNFQILSGALQIEQGNVLHKVYETVSGRRQDEATMPPMPPMPPMPVSSPTAPMPPMPVSSPTAPMPPMPVSSPTAPMPPMPIYGPTAPMSPMPMSGPTAPMPPMPIYGPTAPMPSMPIYGPTSPVSIMPPMPVSIHAAPMPQPRIMAPMPFSNIIVSKPAFVSPVVISSTMVSKPVLRTVAPVQANLAPMTLSAQNTAVVTTYVVKKSHFP
uniref:arp2/3 complex-activating protein rickA-like n=1 Tax=Scatophagus argus TaxID=75038 RepID=UPI001ED7CBDD|nr:arp2/3 complex-activating protein rickA-like [Scatophagus argus]